MSRLTVDIITGHAFYETRKERFYTLKRSPENIRKRQWLSKKYIYRSFMYAKHNLDLRDIQLKQIGYIWSKQVRGDVNKFPSINQVFHGLSQYLEDYLRKALSSYAKSWQQKCIDRYKVLLHYILELVEYENSNLTLTAEDLRNPYSLPCCLILYIYSMEGPFTCLFDRPYDHSKMSEKEYQFFIQTIGPFDRCLQEILHGRAELNRFDKLDSSSIV